MKSMSSKNAFVLILFACMSLPFLGYGQAIPVTVEINADGKWQLFREGQPYYITGVGGDDYLEKAKAIGANSVRTWSPDNAQQVLDEAHKLGLTVTMGLWVQHERHGYDYNNTVKVQAQLEYFTSVVMKYKDHPALLMWGVGNEVDLAYSNTKVWDAVEDIRSQSSNHHSYCRLGS
jgi:Glycosyl hydrolases family 2, TIM barrel domain